jgi:hypothetical protein
MAVRIGDRGRTLSAMSPGGKVRVNGATYDARSEGLWLDAGCDCIVLRGDLAGLVIRRLDPDQPLTLPNHGQPIFRAETQRSAAEVEEVEEFERQRDRRLLAEQARKGSITAATIGGVIGLLAGLIAVFVPGLLGESAVTTDFLLIGGSTVAGAACGALLYIAMCYWPGLLGTRVRPDSIADVSFVMVIAVLVGAFGGALFGLWASGAIAALGGAGLGAAAAWAATVVAFQIFSGDASGN